MYNTTMKEDILMDLGLSKNESKIYLSLLEQGISTATQVAEKSGIHRVNVYDSLNKLKERDLVGEINISNKKCYQASSPEILKNIIKEKEMKLNKILPQLALFQQMNQTKIDVQVYTGYDYIRKMMLKFLSMKEDVYVMDAPKFILERVGRDFQEVIHKRRIEQKQTMWHLYSKEAIDRVKVLNTYPYTEAKCLEQEHSNYVSTFLCGDESFIIIHDESNNKKTCTAIRIKNKGLSETYKNHFKILWKRCKKPE